MAVLFERYSSGIGPSDLSPFLVFAMHYVGREIRVAKARSVDIVAPMAYLQLQGDLPPKRDDLEPQVMWAWEMLGFLARGRFAVDTPFRQLVVTTVLRSGETFRGILALLELGAPRQAAMLAGPLFEDLVVGHWLMLHRDEPDWLIDRFFRHRDAIVLNQEKVEHATSMMMSLRLPGDRDAVARQGAELLQEFGDEAEKDWWDPETQGRGRGEPVGITGIVGCLEDAAASGIMFMPRFAGGGEPLLRRFEHGAYRWFVRFLHHTAAALAAQPMPKGGPAESPNPAGAVLFVAGWMFAQQAFLMHELYGENPRDFEQILAAWFIEGYGASATDLRWPYAHEDD